MDMNCECVCVTCFVIFFSIKLQTMLTCLVNVSRVPSAACRFCEVYLSSVYVWPIIIEEYQKVCVCDVVVLNKCFGAT